MNLPGTVLLQSSFLSINDIIYNVMRLDFSVNHELTGFISPPYLEERQTIVEVIRLIVKDF